MGNKDMGVAAFKAGIWYTVVNFITKGATFLTTPVFTRLMSKADIGAFSNINSWFQVLVYFVTLDLTTSLSLARFDYANELDRYTSSILVYGSAFTAFVYLIVNLNIGFFAKLLSIPTYAVHAIFINMMLCPALSAFQERSIFAYRYKASAAISISSLVLSVGISLVLVFLMKNQLMGRVIGMFLSVSILYLALYVRFMVKGGGISLKYIKYALSISLPMIFHSIAIHLLGTGDRIIITKLLGPDKNALYTVAFTSSIIVSMLWNAMNTAWAPWAAERMHKEETSQLKKASKPYILFYALVVFGMLLITPEILLIMGGRSYMEAKWVIPPVVVGCLCQFIYSLYVNIEFFLKKQKRIAFATMIAAGLNIGLNYIFIPIFGYVAAAYTTLFGYLFLLIFHYISVVNLGKNDWYDGKFNFSIVALFLLLIPVSNLLYLHNTIRYIVIVICGAAVIAITWIYRKQVIRFLKERLGM